MTPTSGKESGRPEKFHLQSPSLDRNATRATLGFGGQSTDFSMGLSPTPIAHVSASPQCHPGRSDFPSPVGDHGISHTAFLMKARLKCLLTYTPNLISLLYDSWQRCRCPSYPGTVSCNGLLLPPPCAESPFAHSRCYLS